jgi:hypothetical protein
MSTIDRRAFVVGCLAVPLAGCPAPGTGPALLTSSPPAINFQNNGSWKNYGNTTIGDVWVYVVTPGFKS